MLKRGGVANGRQEPPNSVPAWRKARSALKLLQVRLRIPLVLIFAAFVVGRWDVIGNYFDKFTRSPLAENAAMRPVSTDTEYFCPMDPGVVSDWPGKCGICNMGLVRRKRGEAVALPDGVVARMQISPYRLQLAGIQTSPVAYRPLMREFASAGVVVKDGGAVTVQLELPVRQAAWICDGQAAEVACPDMPGQSPLTACVRKITRVSDGGWDHLRATVVVDRPPESLGAGMMAVVRIRRPMADLEPFRSLGKSQPPGEVLAVPQSAVVDGGAGKVVFVERMPGMFDGVEVVLGPRSNGFFPVVRGLEAGQNVATSGAFLLDAETRLNPSLAAAYFGAARKQQTKERAGPGPVQSNSSPSIGQPMSDSGTPQGLDNLTAADLVLAKRQRTCPVTGKLLGSMGTPARIVVSGRTVFLCCDGCAEPFQREAAKYLAKLSASARP
jgi:Cu(I)/Ag(I) efflux system membrane fusion protein